MTRGAARVEKMVESKQQWNITLLHNIGRVHVGIPEVDRVCGGGAYDDDHIIARASQYKYKFVQEEY